MKKQQTIAIPGVLLIMAFSVKSFAQDPSMLGPLSSVEGWTGTVKVECTWKETNEGGTEDLLIVAEGPLTIMDEAMKGQPYHTCWPQLNPADFISNPQMLETGTKKWEATIRYSHKTTIKPEMGNKWGHIECAGNQIQKSRVVLSANSQVYELTIEVDKIPVHCIGERDEQKVDEERDDGNFSLALKDIQIPKSGKELIGNKTILKDGRKYNVTWSLRPK